MNEIKCYFKQVTVWWLLNVVFPLIFMCEVAVCLTVVCRAVILFLVFLVLCVIFDFLVVGCFRKLLPHQIGY